MFEVGRVCIKLAGRDAGRHCIIIDVMDDVFVMIDGQTRRRKCNIRHLEPLDKVLKIKKGASHADVVKVLKEEGITVVETKPKKKSQKPVKSKKSKETMPEETVSEVKEAKEETETSQKNEKKDAQKTKSSAKKDNKK